MKDSPGMDICAKCDLRFNCIVMNVVRDNAKYAIAPLRHTMISGNCACSPLESVVLHGGLCIDQITTGKLFHFITFNPLAAEFLSNRIEDEKRGSD